MFVAVPARGQEVPADYKAVLETLGRSGDFKGGVLKVNVPRADLKVTIKGRSAPTPFGFGGWLALTKATGGQDVMMGDLVLTEDEVNPVMSALLTNGLGRHRVAQPLLLGSAAHLLHAPSRARHCR